MAKSFLHTLLYTLSLHSTEILIPNSQSDLSQWITPFGLIMNMHQLGPVISTTQGLEIEECNILQSLKSFIISEFIIYITTSQPTSLFAPYLNKYHHYYPPSWLKLETSDPSLLFMVPHIPRKVLFFITPLYQFWNQHHCHYPHPGHHCLD